MDEVLYYISQGEEKGAESFAYITSIHSSKQYQSFRHSSSPRFGTCLTGIGPGERIFTCDSKRAIINVYSWGKESIDQKIPIPEALNTLHIIHHPDVSETKHKKSNYRIPWLLIGGSKSGKLYIWELSSGDLLCVKEAHYQGITVIKSSECKTFLITGGEDARCIIWKISDLISIYETKEDEEEEENNQRNLKPYWIITENTLPITDLILNSVGIINDLKLYTSSKDGTVRIYDIFTKTQLTTFVLPDSVECITKDPANRALYVGLNNGLIKMLPLYKYNSHTSILESVGGLNKIITIESQDPNLNQTFIQHQNSSITNLIMSMDGTSIISSDIKGEVYVSDIVTKQTIKSFQPLGFPISYLYIATLPVSVLDNTNNIRSDKKHRMIPPLKRVLASNNPIDHNLIIDIPEEINFSGDTDDSDEENFNSWLEQKRIEELKFKNLSNIDSTVKKVGNGNTTNNDLEIKLKKVSEAYTDLRSKHEELIKEHAKLLDKI
ncbi:IPI3 [Candida pseudojiufengensis]|uniref:IPI3 n=1 Tax=Candida pseudojiufengensis TaxID=497109 RepID=UPI002224B39D|nr:IPI3 [Candida pseudojiufengensis]KAI5963299.1 IPI3 [Candida pseudojiufengensis]